MPPGRPIATLAAALAATLALAAAAPASEVCEAPPASGPVALMILANGKKVHELAGSVGRGVPVVVRDARTVIFSDGRVITADVEGAGRALNQLGWNQRPIQVVVSTAGLRARPTRRRG